MTFARNIAKDLVTKPGKKISLGSLVEPMSFSSFDVYADSTVMPTEPLLHCYIKHCNKHNPLREFRTFFCYFVRNHICVVPGAGIAFTHPSGACLDYAIFSVHDHRYLWRSSDCRRSSVRDSVLIRVCPCVGVKIRHSVECGLEGQSNIVLCVCTRAREELSEEVTFTALYTETT